jgi:hypothetical protein
LIVEQNQNTFWFDRCDLDCSVGDNIPQLLVSWHNLLARSTCWGISAIALCGPEQHVNWFRKMQSQNARNCKMHWSLQL